MTTGSTPTRATTARTSSWFGIQEPTAKDNGSEQNGQPQPPDVRVAGALPVANYTIRNATLIGAGTNTTGNDALRFRQENKGRWFNSVFTEFGGVRVRIDDDGVSTPEVKNNLFWGFNAGTTEDYGGPYAPADVNPVANPKLLSISRKQDGKLDPRPAADSPAFSRSDEHPGRRLLDTGQLQGRFRRQRQLGLRLDRPQCRGDLPGPRQRGVYVDSTHLYGTYNWSCDRTCTS
jgi:hypothetical protein